MSRQFFRIAALSAIIPLLSAFRLFSERPFSQQLVELFQAHSESHPVEKIYLHTDRDTYLTGETVWLKGYLVNGMNHDLDTVSRVVYVDLIDPATRRVWRHSALRSPGGFAPGNLLLPDSLPPGAYQLRAYTNYMRNASEAYFCTKAIQILSGSETPAVQLAPTGSNVVRPNVARPNVARPNVARPDVAWPDVARPDVQFMPEGGQLVEGIEGRVAFKVISSAGRGLGGEGYVVSSRRDTVTGFSARHLGMGFFTIKPEAGQTYTVHMTFADGSNGTYTLPAAQPQGLVMQIDNLRDKDYIRVYMFHNKPSAPPTDSLTLLAQTRGQVTQVVSVPLARKAAIVRLSKAEFPEGISQLTLFDEQHRPVCERLIFVEHNHRMNVTLTPEKSSYKPREAVTVKVTTTDAAGKPMAANLSLAALDAQQAPDHDSLHASIGSYLLLSSDLVGTVEQPNGYFNPANPNRLQHLDLLLLTQGWRRFAWPDVLNKAPAQFHHPVEQGLSLTGRVTRPNQKDVGTTVNLTMMLARRDSTRQMLLSETDAAGNYGFYDLDFTDTATVFIQGVKGTANRNLSISLDQLLKPTVTFVRVPFNPVEVSTQDLTNFVRRANENLAIERKLRGGDILLTAVTVKARKYVAPDSRVIYSTPSKSLKLDAINTAGALTILDVLQGRMAGVQVTGSGLNAQVQIRGAANFQGAISPLFLLDGMPVDLQSILSISVFDVEKIDVLTGAQAAIFGSRSAGGVISVLTKRGNPDYDFSKDVVPGTLVTKVPGYAAVREFYSPRYDVPKPEHNLPDHRTTLFWAPMIQTDATGKATVSFFTSDAKSPIRLRAEGITTDGRPGSGGAVIE